MTAKSPGIDLRNRRQCPPRLVRLRPRGHAWPLTGLIALVCSLGTALASDGQPKPGVSTMATPVCTFERQPLDGPGTLARAKAETLRRGGSWDGDLAGGAFVMKTPFGEIVGRYQVDGPQVTFLVERKPGLVPCALIATVIDQFVSP